MWGGGGGKIRCDWGESEEERVGCVGGAGGGGGGAKRGTDPRPATHTNSRLSAGWRMDHGNKC